MPCAEMEKRLQGYLDDELDIASVLQVETHLETCEACRRYVANQKLLDRTLRTEGRYYSTPARLEEALRRIPEQTAPEADKKVEKRPSGVRRPLFRQGFRPALLVPALTILALAALLWWRWNPGPQRDELIAQEALDSHLRALATGHLADVLSSDRHTVKPWFAGKLDYAPPLEDFAGQGFVLLGGRLDYLNGRPVAGLTYQRSKHILYLTILPSARADTGDVQETRQGFGIHHWIQNRMEYWLISDISAAESTRFADLYRSRLSAAPH